LIALFLLALALDPELVKVEERYNNTRSLRVRFTQEFRGPASPGARSESGWLTLRKPGQMRWDYDAPKGKVFLSDGKATWFFNPDAKRAEKELLRQSEDLRGPLAFLLGRVNFRKDFASIKRESRESFVAYPASDAVIWREVRFLIQPESGEIRLVEVFGRDQSRSVWKFAEEQLNVSTKPTMFQFVPPVGTEIVDRTRQ
jgi:outer membrane lipoprotein carrier protein